MRPESLAFPWSSLQEGQGLYRLGASLKLKRWIEELADHLPSADEIIQRLNKLRRLRRIGQVGHTQKIGLPWVRNCCYANSPSVLVFHKEQLGVPATAAREMQRGGNEIHASGYGQTDGDDF
jgi:hypothetical protein